MRPRKNFLQLMESFAAFSLLLLVGHLLIVLRIEAADAGGRSGGISCQSTWNWNYCNSTL